MDENYLKALKMSKEILADQTDAILQGPME